MPNFEYIAKDAAGAPQSGVMQADSEAAVARTLSQRALFPVRISPKAATTAQRMSGSVRLRDLATSYSQMSDLLRAGVPMMRSLEILARTAANATLGNLLSNVRDEVAAGTTLADAMGKYPRVFTNLHVAMIRAGESAGFLEDVLANLSTYLERQDELRSKVRGAMIYPAILVTIGVGAVGIVLVSFVPMFEKVLDVHTLPWPSKILFGLSDLLRVQWPLLLGTFAVLLAGAIWYVRRPAGRLRWSRWQLKIPVVGKAIRMVAITRFCRILGTLMKNGVAIIQALSISKDATGNAILSAAIDAAAENVRAGQSLSEPLSVSKLFPPEIIEMIAVGEESNQLEKVLLETADAVERRTNRQVDTAVRLVEPLLLLFIAGAIAFIALGLLYPIFTMAKTMR